MLWLTRSPLGMLDCLVVASGAVGGGARGRSVALSEESFEPLLELDVGELALDVALSELIERLTVGLSVVARRPSTEIAADGPDSGDKSDQSEHNRQNEHGSNH